MGILKKALDEKALEKITGGKKEPDRKDYLYKGIVTIDASVKTLPDGYSKEVCTARAGTIIYVTDNSCGNNFVYCMFKGERHREYGYISCNLFTKVVE